MEAETHVDHGFEVETTGDHVNRRLIGVAVSRLVLLLRSLELHCITKCCLHFLKNRAVEYTNRSLKLMVLNRLKTLDIRITSRSQKVHRRKLNLVI